MLDQLDRNGAARLPQDARREQLIGASIRAIAEHGLSNVTLSKVASLAGLTAGMVNFHFESKRELLRATLAHVAADYSAACRAAVAGAGGDAATALLALIQTSLSETLASPEKLAVWYAFWGESQARDDYMEICGAADQAFYDTVHGLIGELAAIILVFGTAAKLGPRVNRALLGISAIALFCFGIYQLWLGAAIR